MGGWGWGINTPFFGGFLGQSYSVCQCSACVCASVMCESVCQCMSGKGGG